MHVEKTPFKQTERQNYYFNSTDTESDKLAFEPKTEFANSKIKTSNPRSHLQNNCSRKHKMVAIFNSIVDNNTFLSLLLFLFLLDASIAAYKERIKNQRERKVLVYHALEKKRK
jgi:hypothetical protein